MPATVTPAQVDIDPGRLVAMSMIHDVTNDVRFTDRHGRTYRVTGVYRLCSPDGVVGGNGLVVHAIGQTQRGTDYQRGYRASGAMFEISRLDEHAPDVAAGVRAAVAQAPEPAIDQAPDLEPEPAPLETGGRHTDECLRMGWDLLCAGLADGRTECVAADAADPDDVAATAAWITDEILPVYGVEAFAHDPGGMIAYHAHGGRAGADPDDGTAARAIVVVLKAHEIAQRSAPYLVLDGPANPDEDDRP